MLGANDDASAKFTDRVLSALEKISPELVPRLLDHPLGDAILEGTRAFPRLIALYGKARDDNERAAVVDAVAEIISREHATREVMAALSKWLGTTKSPAVTSIACRALALARDEGFLEQQRNFLASPSLGQVRVSAKLLGFGKYTRAVPELLDLLRPDNMAVSDVVIWALGEIGDAAALPKLHGMLSDFITTEDVLEAMGKIGHVTSVVRLVPILVEGTATQREHAARALARIARKNDGWLGDEDTGKTARSVLERVIDGDASKVARFHAIVAYSLLGGTLEPKRIMAALGADMSDKDLDAMSRFFARKGKPATSPPMKKAAPASPPAKAAAPAKAAPSSAKAAPAPAKAPPAKPAAKPDAKPGPKKR